MTVASSPSSVEVSFQLASHIVNDHFPTHPLQLKLIMFMVAGLHREQSAYEPRSVVFFTRPENSQPRYCWCWC